MTVCALPDVPSYSLYVFSAVSKRPFVCLVRSSALPIGPEFLRVPNFQVPSHELGLHAHMTSSGTAVHTEHP